ncbi:MAG: alpha/beta fold hydrolase [Nitrososphaera sp.]|jgi:pimeloyl-ACP methyl ester carboxylesterase
MARDNSGTLATRGHSNSIVKVPQEHITTVDGIKTHYFESGPDTQGHVLFIHGLGSSADRWLDIPLALSFHYHTLAIDLPGFGLSDKPSPGGAMEYTIQDFARFVVQFLRSLGFEDRRTTLVGHSLGGYIAAEVAVQNRELVDKLVLVDTSGMLDGPTPLLKQYLAAALNPTRQTVRPVLEQLVANPVRIPDALVDGFIYRLGLQGAREAFVAAYDNSVSTQLGKQRLEQIASKTLLIWGSQDKLIPLEPYCNIFHQSIRDSRLVVIDDAGHAPFSEKPAVFCEVVKQFLRHS